MLAKNALQQDGVTLNNRRIKHPTRHQQETTRNNKKQSLKGYNPKTSPS
jgi:hypothetical protein